MLGLNDVEIFWTCVGILFIIWVMKCVYMRHYGATGRHHTYWFDEVYPNGAVWFQCDEWWTMPRFSRAVPRQFENRSNPLDVPVTYETVEVPPRVRRIEREVEY